MNRRKFLRLTAVAAPAAAMIGLVGASDGTVIAQQPSASPPASTEVTIPTSVLIQSNELASMVQGPEKPLVFQVGSHVLYAEAHIPGSEYVGATKSSEGIEAFRDRLSKVSKDQLIVIYCGCCPWVRCPNIRPAFEQLHAMGFTRVRVLYVENNFGKDWVDEGYPTDKGR
jgi:thiosulfate/3-mercaptopyruvate sulfurtransferase